MLQHEEPCEASRINAIQCAHKGVLFFTYETSNTKGTQAGLIVVDLCRPQGGIDPDYSLQQAICVHLRQRNQRSARQVEGGNYAARIDRSISKSASAGKWRAILEDDRQA